VNHEISACLLGGLRRSARLLSFFPQQQINYPTSITVQISVETERRGNPFQPVTAAEVVYVNVDGGPERRPVPLF